MTIEVRLTWHEVAHAAYVGCQRRVSGLAKHRRERYAGGSVLEKWGGDIEGAIAECAVAKCLRMYWTGALGDLRADDVGELQVRCTDCAAGHLVLHKTDQDEKPYLLVIGSAPQYRLVGWLMGGEGKREEWWADKKGNGGWAYFVPQTALRRDVERWKMPLRGRWDGGDKPSPIRHMPGAVSVDRGPGVRPRIVPPPL